MLIPKCDRSEFISLPCVLEERRRRRGDNSVVVLVAAD